MKRLLAFALLFASGLSLLLWLQARRSDDAERRPADGRGEEGVSGSASGSALELDGSFLVTRYSSERGGTRRPLFQIEATDTRTLDDAAVFQDVRAVLYDTDAETDAHSVVVRIRADEGRLELRESGLAYPIRLEESVAEDRLVLEGVELELHENAPVTPLTLSVARLEGDLAQELFTSDERATAVGPGLDASGVGLLLDFRRGVLRFDREARVELQDPDAGRAVLSSGGKMHVLRGTGGGAEVIARGGAELQLEGDEAATILGERINVIASAAPDGGMRLSRLSADGGSVVELPLGRFEAERADLQVAPRGNMRAELSGAPTATVVFETERAGGDGSVEVALSGRGPLVVDLAAQGSFEFRGPTRAEWDGNVLLSRGGLRGWSEADGGFSLSCWDDVQLLQPDARLTTVALDLRVAPGPGGEPLVELATGGRSRLAGVSVDGDPFVLDAEQRVVYRQEGDAWSVPLALGIELQIDAEPPTTVRAERLEDLDVAARELLAEGAVEVERGERRVVGDRFRSLGPDRYLLYGPPGGLAHVEDPEWYVEGEALTREGETFSARGSARLELERGPASLRVGANSLLGTVRDAPEDGSSFREYEFWTEGGVLAVLEAGPRHAEVTSATLHALVRDELDADGNLVTSRARLDLDGEVRGRWERGGERHTLASRSVHVRLSRGARRQPEWEAAARGGVDLRSEGESAYRGVGDELLIDRTGETLLAGLDGRHVRVEGVLPGGRYPFALEAPAARVTTERVRAEDVRLWVEELGLVPGPSDTLAELTRDAESDGDADGHPVAELAVSAGRMSAVAGDLYLADGVELAGLDRSGEEVFLEAAYLQFQTGPGPRSERPTFERMNAWGGFQLRYGGDLDVRGDRLEARSSTGRLRIRGTPARVALGDWVQESDLLEYDLFLRIIVRTAGGWFRPRE